MKNVRRLLAILWTLFCLAAAAFTLLEVASGRFVPDTDILSMLPKARHDAVKNAALANMVDHAEQKALILLGSTSREDASRAADAYEAALAAHHDLIEAEPVGTENAAADAAAWLAPYRGRLLSRKDRKNLKHYDENAWLEEATAELYGMAGSTLRLLPWREDPFGLVNGWLAERLADTRARPVDGRLVVDDGQTVYVVLPLAIGQSVFASSVQEKLMPVLDNAKRQALAAAPVTVYSAGVIFHTARATALAKRDMAIISAGSIIGIVLLIWLAFHAFRPIVLVAFSLACGLSVAFSVCTLFFGKIHVMTLVFGGSIIGLAQDYGIFWLCQRAKDSKTPSDTLLNRLLPAMVLTAATTLAAYAGLLATPFDGLRQMAAFAITGLLCAWLTVVLCFPRLTHEKSFKRPPGLHAYQQLVGRWPRLGANRLTVVAGLLFAAAVATGLLRLRANDDIRLLQNTDSTALAEQIAVSRLMDMPSMAQFFVVTGKTQQEVLMREEALKDRLDALLENGTISGSTALSDWLPSMARQKENRELVDKTLDAPGGAADRLMALTGLARQKAPGENALTFEILMGSSARAAATPLWLGETAGHMAGVVTLKGVTPESLDALKALENPAAGIHFVDKVGDISAAFAHYRKLLGLFVAAAYAIIFVVLCLRYRLGAWRILFAPAAATLTVLAFLGLAGMPLNLFHLLALLLVLGVGVDSGIFFAEHAGTLPELTWLETGLAAASTMLSFGLLSLSTMPALRSFGLAMLVGMASVWLIVPCLRPKADTCTKESP